MPWVTGLQVPSMVPVKAAVHAMQVPAHAVLQQIPRTQWPFVQSVFTAHVWPLAAGPQVLLPRQLPLAQSPLPTQTTQLPAPSQTLAPPAPVHAVSGASLPTTQVCVDFMHVTFLHAPGLGQSELLEQPTQLPMPSHTCVPPQLMPAATLVMTTFIIEQELVTHGLEDGGTLALSATVTTIPAVQFSVLQFIAGLT
jgi:hypothetical protein